MFNKEQQLFSILIDVNNKFISSPGVKYDLFFKFVPVELLSYIEENSNNRKALARLTSYLYLTMNEEFNQYLIESEPDDYIGSKCEGIPKEGFAKAISIIGNLEDTIRSYERGDEILPTVDQIIESVF